MIFEHDNYRLYLKSVLADRVARNSSYSLRSFAKTIGLAHSTLSLVFKGTKHLSFERAMDIATKLNLPEKEHEYFSLMVQSDRMKDPEKKAVIVERLNRLKA